MKTWIYGLVLCGISIIVSLVLAEITIRFLYEDKFSTRPDFLIPNDELGWSPSPGLNNRFYGADYSMRIITDEAGYRLGEEGEISPNSELVALLGDSYTFGWGVDSDETFASALDRKLKETTSGKRRAINLGVNGYGTLHYGIRLNELAKRHVRIALVMHSHNDHLDNVVFVLREAGFYEPQPRPKNELATSPFHIVNVLAYWQWGQSHKEDQEVPPLQPNDTLFSAPMKRTSKVSGEVYTSTRTVMYSDIDSRDHNYRAPRVGLSPIQKELLHRGIHKIHCTLPRVVIMHTAIHTAPKWFTDAVEHAVLSARSCDSEPLWMGKIELSPKDSQRAFNRHRGGHFTPEVNKIYADIVYQWVQEASFKMKYLKVAPKHKR